MAGIELMWMDNNCTNMSCRLEVSSRVLLPVASLYPVVIVTDCTQC